MCLKAYTLLLCCVFAISSHFSGEVSLIHSKTIKTCQVKVKNFETKTGISQIDNNRGFVFEH